MLTEQGTTIVDQSQPTSEEKYQATIVDINTSVEKENKQEISPDNQLDFLWSLLGESVNKDIIKFIYEENDKDVYETLDVLLDITRLEQEIDDEKEHQKKVEQKRAQRRKKNKKRAQKRTEEKLSNLQSVFPNLSKDSLLAALIACDYNADQAYQQLLIETQGIKHLKKKKSDERKSKERVKDIPAPQFSSRPTTEWKGNDLVKKFKLEKLKNMCSGKVSSEIIEKVFEHSGGQIRQSVKKLHAMYPNLVGPPKDEEKPKPEPKTLPQMKTIPSKPPEPIPDKSQQEYRQEANMHAQKRNQYFNLALQAYMRGDGKTAKQLADQGRVEDRLMREAHYKASMLVFKTQNRDLNTLYTIDLHGLFVNEALDKLEQHIKLARQNHISTLKKYFIHSHFQASLQLLLELENTVTQNQDYSLQ